MFMPLPDPIIEVLTVFRPLFTAPTWRKLMILLTGTPLTRGQRTVAAALRATGNEMAGNWSLFHQVLNRARWAPLAVSRQRLLLIVETFVPAGACVDLVIDETLERRWANGKEEVLTQPSFGEERRESRSSEYSRKWHRKDRKRPTAVQLPLSILPASQFF